MKDTILSILRHVLTIVGGVLVTKGLMSESVALELSGCLSSGIGLIWGALDEFKAAKAAKAPAADEAK